MFRVCLFMTWKNWRQALIIVKTETVVSWHRRGFRPSELDLQKEAPRSPLGHSEIRALIRKMAAANPLWGAPRIHGECSSSLSRSRNEPCLASLSVAKIAFGPN